MMQAASRKCLMNVGEKLSDMHIALSKAHVLINNLMSNYFACNKEGHEDDGGMRLLHDYEEAQAFIGRANDCIHVALKCVHKALDEIDREGGDEEDSTK